MIGLRVNILAIITLCCHHSWFFDLYFWLHQLLKGKKKQEYWENDKIQIREENFKHKSSMKSYLTTKSEHCFVAVFIFSKSVIGSLTFVIHIFMLFLPSPSIQFFHIYKPLFSAPVS